MKKYIVFFITTLFLLNGCSNDLPTYKLEANFNTIVIGGTKYAVHKLSYKDKTYKSEPEQFTNPDYYESFQIGKQIGRTSDGMQIFQVKNDDERLAIKGFMYPVDFFILDRD